MDMKEEGSRVLERSKTWIILEISVKKKNAFVFEISVSVKIPFPLNLYAACD